MEIVVLLILFIKTEKRKLYVKFLGDLTILLLSSIEPD